MSFFYLFILKNYIFIEHKIESIELYIRGEHTWNITCWGIKSNLNAHSLAMRVHLGIFFFVVAISLHICINITFFLIFFDTLKLEACKSRLINVPKYEKNVQWISKLHANSIYCGEHEFALFVVYFLPLDSFIKFSSLAGHFFVHFTDFCWVWRCCGCFVFYPLCLMLVRKSISFLFISHKARRVKYFL